MQNKPGRLYIWLTTLLLLFSTVLGRSNAQVTLPPLLSNNAGILVYEDENGIPTNITSAYDIIDMVWSHDGKNIGFIKFNRTNLSQPIK